MKRREFVALAPAFTAAAATASLTLREEGKPPIELDVAVLKCHPGDTLVLSHPGGITADTAQRIQEHVKYIVGGDVKAMVLSDGLKLEGVVRGPV